jgi:hypothetical protein
MIFNFIKFLVRKFAVYIIDKQDVNFKMKVVYGFVARLLNFIKNAKLMLIFSSVFNSLHNNSLTLSLQIKQIQSAF